MSNTIHRSQIVSVNNTLMIVRSPSVREGVTQAAKEASQVLANPFRQGTLPPD